MSGPINVGIKLTADGAAATAAGVKQVESAIGGLAAKHDQAAASSGRAAYQTTQLSNQLQDLFVQIQAGANPLTAFIQQGSQVSAVYGGFGNAIKGVGALITPLTVAITAAALPVIALGASLAAGAAESAAFRASLALTGNMAGTTAGQFDAMSKSIGASTLVGVGAAREALQALIASGRIANEALAATGAASAAMARATGQSSSEMAAKFAAMVNDVAGGAEKLNEQYHFLTRAQFERIKALEDEGNAQGALVVAMDALNVRLSSQAQNLGYIETTWLAVKGAISGTWDAMKSVGRDRTLEDMIAELEKNSRTYKGGWVGDPTADQAKGAQEYANALKQGAAYQALDAHYAGEKAVADEAALKWSKEVVASSSEQAKLQKEIRDLVGKGTAARATEAEIAGVVSEHIQASKAFAEGLAVAMARVGASAAVAAANTASLQSKLKGQLEGGQLTHVQYMQAEAKARADGMRAEAAALQQTIGIAKSRKDSEAEVATLVGQLSAKQISIKAAERDAVVAIDNYITARRIASFNVTRSMLEQEAQEYAAYVADQGKSVKALDESLSNYAQGIADSVRVSQAERSTALQDVATRNVVLGQLRVQIELEKQLRAIDDNRALDPQQRATAVAKANEAAAKSSAEATTRIYADEWNKTFKEVQDGLYDALVHGGKDGWKKIAAYVESQVLKPVIQGITSPLSSALTSAFLPGTAAAAGGSSAISGAAGLAGIAGSISAVSAGAGYGMSSLFAGSGVAALGGAAEMAAAGQIASALGTVAGVLGPVALGIVALSSLDKKATPHVGGYALASAAGVSDITAQQGGIQQADTQSAVSALATGLAASLNTVAKTFGQEAAYSVRAVFESDNKDGSWGMLHVLQGGIKQTGSFDANGTLKADASSGLAQFSGMAAKGVADALQAIDLPKWADEALSKITEGDGADKLGQIVDQIVSTEKAVDALGARFDGMGGIFGKVAALSSDVTVSLAVMSGGIDKLAANLDGYYANFYSDSERSALALQTVGKTLADVGIDTVPKTRAEFRNLVDGLNLSTDAGQKMFAALMNVQGAFADAVAPAEELAVKLKSAAEITSERLSLEGQLLELQGNTTELRRREAAQLDPSNRALYDRINALKDERDAAAAAATKAKTLADALGQLIEGLRSAASDAMNVLQQTIQSAKDKLTAQYTADSNAIDAQITAAKKAYDDLLKQLDAQREAAKAVYDNEVKAIEASRKALEDAQKAQAKQYAANTKALADERDATTKAYKAAIDKLDASIKSQKTTVDNLKALNDSLASTLAALNPIDSEATQRSRAQAQIRDALMVAQSTGVLPNADDLKNALSTVAKPSEDLFGSFEDYLRDFYRTSLDIRDLGKIAGTQLDSATTQLDAMVALRDATEAGYQAEMVRLDGIKDALDLANDQAREAFAAQSEALSGRLDTARSNYDASLSGFDAQQKAAKDALDSKTSMLEDQKQALKDNYEAQLAKLDGLLEIAKNQYDALMHISGKADTIDAALAGLASALSALASATGQRQPTLPTSQTSTPSQVTAATNQWVTTGNVQTYTDSAGAVAIMNTGANATSAIVQGTNNDVFTVQDIRDFVTAHLASHDLAGIVVRAGQVGLSPTAIDDAMGYTRGTFDAMVKGTSVAGYAPGDVRAFTEYWMAQGDARKVYDKAKDIGLTSASLDALMAWAPGTALGWATANGLPAFAAGGTFGGGMALVGENGPEIIKTGPARIYNNSDTLAMLNDPQRRDSVLVTEIQRLRQEVADMRADNNAGHQATASSTGRTARVIVDRWEIDGMPPTRTTT